MSTNLKRPSQPSTTSIRSTCCRQTSNSKRIFFAMKNLSIVLSVLVLLILLLDISTTNERLRKLEGKMAGDVDRSVAESTYMTDEEANDEGNLDQERTDIAGNWAPAVSIELPAEMSFAGEPVPLNLPDVRERFDRELHINSYLHNSTIFI